MTQNSGQGRARETVATSPTRATLSVVIPTKNAAHLLGDALSSVSWADEVLVIDMFSEDDTAALCAAFPNCRLIQRQDYIFGNVNHGFNQATSDWVLRMDSDERISPELAEEIRGVLENSPEEVVGYEFRQEVFILGKRLRYGGGRPSHRKMMFRRGAARYAVEHEHEDLTTSGIWHQLEHPYWHYNYNSVSDYLRKMDYYTQRDVERRALPSRKPRQRRAVFEATRAFYFYYLKLQGFRDGWIGLLDAAMRSIYQFVFWAKLMERWEASSGHETMTQKP